MEYKIFGSTFFHYYSFSESLESFACTQESITKNNASLFHTHTEIYIYANEKRDYYIII